MRKYIVTQRNLLFWICSSDFSSRPSSLSRLFQFIYRGAESWHWSI